MENFGQYKAQIIQRISDVMRQNYTTKTELAKKLDLDYETVRRLFGSGTYLPVERLIDIAQALNVPVKTLLPDNGGAH